MLIPYLLTCTKMLRMILELSVGFYETFRSHFVLMYLYSTNCLLFLLTQLETSLYLFKLIFNLSIYCIFIFIRK